MPVKVGFFTPGKLGAIDAIGVGNCRVSETLTVPGTTTITAADGEMALLVSTEASTVVAAHGLNPDAAAVIFAGNQQTSAGYGVPPGTFVPVVVRNGDKINIKAFV